MPNIVPPTTFALRNDDNIHHVVKCASYCYNSLPSDPQKTYRRLINDGHVSMLRHATYYYRVPSHVINGYYAQYFEANSYCHITPTIKGFRYLVLNGNFVHDHQKLIRGSGIAPYECSYARFKMEPKAINLIRLTFVIDTQIAISRELNRVSPNNISERSTRYIDYLRKLGIRFSRPHWHEGLNLYRRALTHLLLSLASAAYHIARSKYGIGLKPEDARYFLPLATETRVAYTYTIAEWLAIIDKRFNDTTGKAHPDAKIAVKPIKDYIHNFLSIALNEA